MLHTPFSQWVVIMGSNGRHRATPYPRAQAPFDGGIALRARSATRPAIHHRECLVGRRQWKAGCYTRPILDTHNTA